MFWRKQATETAVAPTPPRPRPIQHGEESISEYEELANSLGFNPAQLIHEQLLRFIAKQKMPVYDYGEVSRYLSILARRHSRIWRWVPLRRTDHRADISLLDGEWRLNYHNDVGIYDKAVPIHILRRVKAIGDEFGDRVAFYVSDYRVPNPDPFIIVMAPGMDPICFGVWDEPAFFEKASNIAED